MAYVVTQSFFLIIFILNISHFCGEAKTLTITNNCGYTVWPSIVASGLASTNNPGFALSGGESKVVPVETNWSGQVWGRTLCSTVESTGNFSCQTGDCARGKIECTHGSVGTHTLAELSFNQFNNYDFYDVSLVDGYNLPLMIVPHVQSGPACDVTGCIFDLQKLCPAELMLGKATNESGIIGCRGPCQVFKTDIYCCTGSVICQSTYYSLIFKRHCPKAYSYPTDNADALFTCDSSRVSSYNITFCPSATMSRLLSLPSSQALPPPSPTQEPPPSTVLPPHPFSPATNTTTKPAHQKSSSNTRKSKSLLVAFPTAAAILILVLLGICIFIFRKKFTEKHDVQTNEMRMFADSLQFDFNTIRLATRNFAADNKLGEGGFGEVYKGVLEDGQEIAVKRLSKSSAQGIAEFEAEIILVARLQHKNLVKLLGYCAGPKESLLVYEFLVNSSLDRFLFDSAKKSSLDWQTRFGIIAGIARGLLYLHEDSRIKVVHRDLKSSNILLDEAMNPKIADFGLARLFGVDQTQDNTKRIVGTYGYMAPEYAITGRYSVKSDVYSFGVIVLEIVSGQQNKMFGRVQLEEALLHRAWRLWNENNALDLIDAKLRDIIKTEEVLKCIQIGLLCIQENPSDRPRITSIVAALTDQAISLPVPKPPHFFGYVDGEAPDMYTGAETVTDVYSRD